MTRVLVVDDDAQLRSALARELAEQGMEVEVAQSVEEAETMLKRRHVDVLVTDLRMGERDGIDLLTRARAISADTRAVLMSAYATARDYQTALELGAVKVLCKPFTPTEALDAIQQAVDCKTGFRGSIHGLSLVDMLQMFHYGRRSLALTVGGERPGHLYIAGGEVVHAEHGERTGEDALRSILAAQSGSVTTSALPAKVTRTIEKDFQGLLLDLLRQLDEAAEAGPASSEVTFDWDDEDISSPSRPRAEWIEREARLVARLSAMSCESCVAVVESDNVRCLLGNAPANDAAPALWSAVDAARRLTGVVEKLEMTGGDSGVAVMAISGEQRLLLVYGTLVGRYASLRFRAEVGRIQAALAATEATQA